MCLGIPGQIVRIDDAIRKLGTVDVGGVRRQVNLACVLPPQIDADSLIGEWVLIHVGFAMSRISANEAEQTLQILIELGEAQDEIRAMQQAEGQQAEVPLAEGVR